MTVAIQSLESIALRPPFVWPSAATPCDEVNAIKMVNAHLAGLAYSVLAWEAALTLYKTATNPPLPVSRAVTDRWRFIACNECVLELYHLRCRLEKIQSVLLRTCPSLRQLLDASKMRSSRKMLDEFFPGIEALRHAMAHKGENEAHPEVHAPDGRFALVGFRDPDRFSAPYEGTMYYLDITDQSLQSITEVVVKFFEAFNGATAELEKQGHLD